MVRQFGVLLVFRFYEFFQVFLSYLVFHVNLSEMFRIYPSSTLIIQVLLIFVGQQIQFFITLFKIGFHFY